MLSAPASRIAVCALRSDLVAIPAVTVRSRRRMRRSRDLPVLRINHDRLLEPISARRMFASVMASSRAEFGHRHWPPPSRFAGLVNKSLGGDFAFSSSLILLADLWRVVERPVSWVTVPEIRAKARRSQYARWRQRRLQ
jgi:hypothetical protein